MPRFRAYQPELRASFRSGGAAGQLIAFASAALSREVGYARRAGVVRKRAAEGVENARGGGKAIGSAAKIL
jgi:hypothetical protein